MSTSTLARPAAQRATSVRALTAVPGSYVDTDGVRRAPQQVGSYTGTASAVGTFTGQAAGTVGSYVRSER